VLRLPCLLQVYKGVLQEKLCELVHSGIVVTVNSDDPAFLGGYLNNNYAWLADTTGLGPEQVAQLAKNSFQASFISEEAKQKAMAAVDAALQGWTQHYHGDGHGRPS
jgi:adenosine deaminase